MLCLNKITDTDFKALVSMGLLDTMSNQIKKVEQLLGTFGIPFPKGVPQSVTTKGDPEVWRDEFIFNLLLAGIRNFMNVHLRGVKLFMSDGLRELFDNFLIEELKIQDNLLKYGKIKGWVLNPPAYGHHN